MNKKTLVSIHCYEGDKNQIDMLRPWYEHHNLPIVVVSPEDSKVKKFGPHWCIFAGRKGYTGPHTWTRQHLQMKKLLEFDFDFYLMHDSDSICLDPVLPGYLFEEENKNTIFSNLVDDFRKPGQTTHGRYWPESYHQGYPIKASQPSYMCSREALEKICSVDPTCNDDITPFIDFAMVKWPVDAGVTLKAFEKCASCETVTPMGLQAMTHRVKNGAMFVHAIKSAGVANIMHNLYTRYHKRKGIR